MESERAPWLHRGREFLENGVRLVGSSDRPIADGAPLRPIQFMVDRASESGRLVGPDERIGVDEALRASTSNGAYACRWEDSAGSITAVKRAGLVALEDDPRRVPVSMVGDIAMVGTWLEGHRSTDGPTARRHRRSSGRWPRAHRTHRAPAGQ
ncbi:amidohydrolase family protein [Streptomyces sp. NPDC096193]